MWHDREAPHGPCAAMARYPTHMRTIRGEFYCENTIEALLQSRARARMMGARTRASTPWRRSRPFIAAFGARIVRSKRERKRERRTAVRVRSCYAPHRCCCDPVAARPGRAVYPAPRLRLEGAGRRAHVNVTETEIRPCHTGSCWLRASPSGPRRPSVQHYIDLEHLATGPKNGRS